MTTIKYTLRNAHKGINMGTDPEYNEICEDTGLTQMYFEWDYENTKLDKIAEKEFRLHWGDKKKNMMWIDVLKKNADWKEGEYIYAFTKNNCDGTYYVNWTKNKTLKCGSEFNWFDVMVEPSGYVCMKCFNNYSIAHDDDIKYEYWVRVESLYNDKMCKKISSKK